MRYVQSISEACTIKTYWSDSHEAHSWLQNKENIPQLYQEVKT